MAVDFDRVRYDEFLVSGYLAAADGLIERLRAGVAVADIGCGSAHCLIIMSAAFPASSDLAGNLDHPLGPYLYGISVTHCMCASLAVGRGPGLRTRLGRQLATSMFHDAGFATVEERQAPPEDAIHTIYVCRP